MIRRIVNLAAVVLLVSLASGAQAATDKDKMKKDKAKKDKADVSASDSTSAKP